MCHLIAVIGHTAAELIYSRVDSKKEHMKNIELFKNKYLKESKICGDKNE